MRKKVYGLWFMVYGIFLLSTPSYAQQNIRPSQEEKVQKARDHYAAGKQLVQESNYSAANDEFKKAQALLQDASLENPLPVKEAPKAIVPETNKEGDADEALSFYLKAIELAPGDIDLHYNLALLYLKTKQYKEAAARLEKVIQLNPKDKDAYYNLGVLYESYLGDKKKALDYYAQYIKYGSANTDALEVKQWMRQLKKELKK